MSTSSRDWSSEDDGDVQPSKKPVQVVYRSNDVPIPDDFLSVTTPPPDAQPITIERIDFAASVVPQFAGLYAVVLDNVLSPAECAALLRMAEDSVPDEDRVVKKLPRAKRKPGDAPADGATAKDTPRATFKDPWRPALVNVGGGMEQWLPEYRRGDRIIWDQQEITNRIWERCIQAPGLLDDLARISGDSKVLYQARTVKNPDWKFRRINQRMRFLKYKPGDFFRPHCDGHYTETADGAYLQTMFTLHLYLNDSKAEAGDAADLVGGATSFFTRSDQQLDVNPRCGRVLIFQHHKLRHSGEEVVAGLKYTMRADLLYEMVRLEKDKDGGKESISQ